MTPYLQTGRYEVIIREIVAHTGHAVHMIVQVMNAFEGASSGLVVASASAHSSGLENPVGARAMVYAEQAMSRSGLAFTRTAWIQLTPGTS